LPTIYHRCEMRPNLSGSGLSTLLLHVSTALCVVMSSRKLKEFVRLWRVLPSLILSLILIRTFVNFLFQLLYDFIFFVNFITCTCFENYIYYFFADSRC
jgi:hypothetical protein